MKYLSLAILMILLSGCAALGNAMQAGSQGWTNGYNQALQQQAYYRQANPPQPVYGSSPDNYWQERAAQQQYFRKY